MRPRSLAWPGAALVSLSLASGAAAQGADPASTPPSPADTPAATPATTPSTVPDTPPISSAPQPPTAAPSSPERPRGVAIAPVSTGEGGAIPSVATGHESTFLVPVQVTGGSDGAASARVGFGILTGFGASNDPTGWDLGAVLEAEIATSNGLAGLIGLDRAGEVTQAPVGSLRLSASLARLDFEGEGGSAYPPLLLYFGGTFGRAEFTYLGPGPERRDTSLPPTYQADDLVAFPWSLGLAAVYVGTGGARLAPTVEGEIAFNSRWIGSSDTLSWCEPAGDVVSGLDPDTNAATYEPTTRCKTSVLGAPANSQELSLAAQAGLIDKVANATWRAALGAKVVIPFNDEATDELRLSVRAPFYVTLARAPEGTKYRGLIRLMPSLGITRLKTGDTEVTGLLELSFLGQRAMFSDNYNQL